MSLSAKLTLGAGLVLLVLGLFSSGLPGIGLMVLAMLFVGLSLVFDRPRA